MVTPAIQGRQPDNSAWRQKTNHRTERNLSLRELIVSRFPELTMNGFPSDLWGPLDLEDNPARWFWQFLESGSASRNRDPKLKFSTAGDPADEASEVREDMGQRRTEKVRLKTHTPGRNRRDRAELAGSNHAVARNSWSMSREYRSPTTHGHQYLDWPAGTHRRAEC